MTIHNSTPSPILADMARTRCPDWCVRRATVTVHEIQEQGDNTYVVRHVGQVLVIHRDQVLSLARTVRWTSAGELVDTRDAIELSAFSVDSRRDAIRLADAIKERAMQLPAAAKAAV